MDTQQEKPTIDPARRVLIPIERMTAKGTVVFRTTDNRVYARVEPGAPIHRAIPKTRGKKARAADKRQRLELRRIDARRATMANQQDPRTDRHPNDGTPGSYPTAPGGNDPKPAEGGVGNGNQTGNQRDTPATQPGGERNK